MATRPQFIYFDIGNVFMTYDQIFTRVTSDLNLKPDQFGDFEEPFDIDANLGKITIKEIWQKFCNKLSLPELKNYNIIESWVSDYQHILPIHQFIPKLIDRYNIGILSNYYSGFFEECQKQKFIPILKFSPIIISAEVGCMKPDPKIFQIAEDRSGYKGDQILFVDDKQENLDTALTFGWQTFLFDFHNPQLSVDSLAKILL